MEYGFSDGIIHRTIHSSLAIKLLPSRQIVPTSENASTTSLVARGMPISSSVVVSWICPVRKPRGIPDELDANAIEPANRWLRTSRYQPSFDHADTKLARPGTRAEFWFLDALRRYGIRADHATPFEDEQLGVDIWAFLTLGGSWRWLPIDVTLRPAHPGTVKWRIALQRGVFPLRLRGTLKEDSRDQVSAFLSMIQRGARRPGSTSFLNRKTALAREEALASR